MTIKPRICLRDDINQLFNDYCTHTDVTEYERLAETIVEMVDDVMNEWIVEQTKILEEERRVS